jgi:hypothetical protein
MMVWSQCFSIGLSPDEREIKRDREKKERERERDRER